MYHHEVLYDLLHVLIVEESVEARMIWGGGGDEETEEGVSGCRRASEGQGLIKQGQPYGDTAIVSWLPISVSLRYFASQCSCVHVY